MQTKSNKFQRLAKTLRPYRGTEVLTKVIAKLFSRHERLAAIRARYPRLAKHWKVLPVVVLSGKLAKQLDITTRQLDEALKLLRQPKFGHPLITYLGRKHDKRWGTIRGGLYDCSALADRLQELKTAIPNTLLVDPNITQQTTVKTLTNQTSDGALDSYSFAQAELAKVRDVEIFTRRLLMWPWFKTENPGFNWSRPTVKGADLVAIYKIPAREVLALAESSEPIPAAVLRAHLNLEAA